MPAISGKTASLDIYIPYYDNYLHLYHLCLLQNVHSFYLVSLTTSAPDSNQFEDKLVCKDTLFKFFSGPSPISRRRSACVTTRAPSSTLYVDSSTRTGTVLTLILRLLGSSYWKILRISNKAIVLSL